MEATAHTVGGPLGQHQRTSPLHPTDRKTETHRGPGPPLRSPYPEPWPCRHGSPSQLAGLSPGGAERTWKPGLKSRCEQRWAPSGSPSGGVLPASSSFWAPGRSAPRLCPESLPASPLTPFRETPPGGAAAACWTKPRAHSPDLLSAGAPGTTLERSVGCTCPASVSPRAWRPAVPKACGEAYRPEATCPACRASLRGGGLTLPQTPKPQQCRGT